MPDFQYGKFLSHFSKMVFAANVGLLAPVDMNVWAWPEYALIGFCHSLAKECLSRF